MEYSYKSSYQVKLSHSQSSTRIERNGSSNVYSASQTHAKFTSASNGLMPIPLAPNKLDEEFSKIATKYIEKYTKLAQLSPSCLFSSSCGTSVATGSDLASEGSAARTAGHNRDLVKDRAFFNNSAPDAIEEAKDAAAREVPRRSRTSEDKVEGTPFDRVTISRRVSEAGPRTVPFGQLGGSSRRGYTVANRSYEKLKEECLRSGKLFEDPDFPTIDESVFYTPRFKRAFQWKRPPELVADPKFIVDGANRFDVVQGELGDCWLLAAVADLTLNDALLTRVMPIEQGFTKEDQYCGIFLFRFWRHGQWVEVYIDDRLPTINGKLVFMQSKDSNEFWTALLEKAYAKINGSYENLKGGTASEAMEDFTGGLAECYELNKPPKNLFELALKSFQLGAMMSCSIDAAANQLEARLPNGLVIGHAYSITDVQIIETTANTKTGMPDKIPCVRLRNPWGIIEWTGAFSDGSREWRFVPENIRKRLDVSFGEDGEFWMTFEDLMANFSKFEICNLGPETMVSLDPKFARDHPVTWQASIFAGSWTKGVSAGGCRNYLDTFHLNPQYRVSLREVDGPDGLASCMVALMQKDRRKLKSRGLDFLTVGFSIYALPTDREVPVPLNRDFFRVTASIARSPSFINSRQIAARYRLPPGDYVIIPSTFDPNEEGDFLLRVYSEVPVLMAEHDHIHPAQMILTNAEVHRVTSTEAAHLDEMAMLFHEVAGTDEEIDTHELALALKKALKTDFNFDGFSPETIRSMLTMSDEDFSGRLGLDEFMKLWRTIKQWKDTFQQYDKKRIGCIRLENLREAISAAGYLVNKHVLRVIALRYGQADQTIKFEDFMLCIVRLQRMISIFEGRDELKLRSAVFSFDDWMLNTMYC